MRRIATLTALALALVAAAPASAAWVLPPRTPPTAQELLDRYLPVARAAWPGSPCEGHERVTLNDDAEMDAVLAGHPDLYPRGAAGLAFGHVTDPTSPDFCRVGLRAKLDAPYSFCVRLVHELGHLAGYDHTHTGDVMDADNPTYAPCVPTASPMDDVDWLLRAGLPNPDAWSFSCTVVRHGALRCKGTAPFARHARYRTLGQNVSPGN